LTPSSALETFKAAAMAAGRANTDADFLHEAVHQLAALVGAQRCSILLIEDRRLRHGAAIGLSDTYLEAIDGLEIGPDVGTCGTAGHTGEPYITADIETDPRWESFRDLARAEGMRACWSVPLNLPDGRTIGTAGGLRGQASGQRPLDRPDHVGHADLGRRPRQLVPALGAAARGDDAGLLEVAEDVLEEVQRDVLGVREALPLDHRVPPAAASSIVARTA